MNDRTFRDREILAAAQEKGAGATMGAYLRLSGPGWLQSAITLGGGSLGSALYLGMIGGTDLAVGATGVDHRGRRDAFGDQLRHALDRQATVPSDQPVHQPRFGRRLDHRNDSGQHDFHFATVQSLLRRDRQQPWWQSYRILMHACCLLRQCLLTSPKCLAKFWFRLLFAILATGDRIHEL